MFASKAQVSINPNRAIRIEMLNAGDFVWDPLAQTMREITHIRSKCFSEIPTTTKPITVRKSSISQGVPNADITVLPFQHLLTTQEKFGFGAGKTPTVEAVRVEKIVDKIGYRNDLLPALTNFFDLVLKQPSCILVNEAPFYVSSCGENLMLKNAISSKLGQTNA